LSRDRDAYENRLEALRKLRDARGKTVKLHHSTGRRLAEDGLALRTGTGRWKATEEGIKYIDRTERAEEIALTSTKCYRDEATRERRKKVMAWIDLHARLTNAAQRYVEHVVEALLAGERVRESGYSWDGGDEKCRAWAEIAIDAIEELELAQVEAQEAGGNIVVSYEAGPSVLARAGDRRARVVREIAAGDNVVGLDAYREARA
jgi:hypothetical protein